MLMLVAAILALHTWPCHSPTQQPRLGEDREGEVISDRMWHLGDDVTSDWPEAAEKPDGTRVEMTFLARAFAGEGLLACQQRHVDNVWHIEINGRRVATLDRGAELGEHFYEIPAGVIVDGSNTLVLTGETPTDDITFGKLRYYPYSFRELYDLRRVRVNVSDSEGKPLPSRVTITDDANRLVRVFYGERLATAVRNGVVYSADGVAQFEIPPGRYRVHAARGTEWSLDVAPLLVDGTDHAVALQLRRELDTTGFVAADTHIHTLTHSGHGDASVEERMVTLAGEGVELAIATDHNHNTDYRPTQTAMGLGSYFTPVVGNEVTTPIGHLNAFPLDPTDDVPPHDLRDIVKIVEGIRAKGAATVILNHPRWPSHEKGPHGVIQLDHETGDWVGQWACPFDAVELINSQTDEPSPRVLFRDWFALMNRGERVVAVGSSDSHTVGGVVGQGRTYVRSATDVPSEIDVEEASRNIARGHSSISMGIFVDVRHHGRSVMGETLPRGDLADVDVRVAAPSWVRPRKITLFANGTVVYSRNIEAEPGRATDVTTSLLDSVLWPRHDCWVVALIEGDGARTPAWPQLNDYTLAASNPLFVDGDGDGNYTDPRTLAARAMESIEGDDAAGERLLADVDPAVRAQIERVRRLSAGVSEEATCQAVGSKTMLVGPMSAFRLDVEGSWATVAKADGGDDLARYTLLRARTESLPANKLAEAGGGTLTVMRIPRTERYSAWALTLGRNEGAESEAQMALESTDAVHGWLWSYASPQVAEALVVFSDGDDGDYAIRIRADRSTSRPSPLLEEAARSFRTYRRPPMADFADLPLTPLQHRIVRSSLLMNPSFEVVRILGQRGALLYPGDGEVTPLRAKSLAIYAGELLRKYDEEYAATDRRSPEPALLIRVVGRVAYGEIGQIGGSGVWKREAGEIVLCHMEEERVRGALEDLIRAWRSNAEGNEK